MNVMSEWNQKILYLFLSLTQPEAHWITMTQLLSFRLTPKLSYINHICYHEQQTECQIMTIQMYAYTINLVYVLQVYLNESTQLKCKKSHVRTSGWECLFFPSNLLLLLFFIY